jgi:hypothetical protein
VPDWPGVVAAATDAVDAPGICHSVDVAVGAGGDPEVVAVERRAGLCLRGSPTSGLVRRLEYVGTLPTVDPDAPVTRRLDRVEGLDDPEYALGVLPEGEDVRLAGDAGERRETALASGGTG